MPRLSIVTTCKGRLHHLRESLPTFLAQPDCETIVVDFDCPDRTAEVVAREFPAARLVALKDEPHFDIDRARNAGAKAVLIGTSFCAAPDVEAKVREVTGW